MKRSSLVLVLVVALWACQGSGVPRPAKMPSYSEMCAAGSDEIACLGALSLAAELGQRERVGQLLLLAARSAPAADRRELARAALWLAPGAFMPEELRAELDGELGQPEAPQDGSARLAEGTVLRLRGSTTPAPAEMRALDLDLAVPLGGGALAGAALAGLLAAASGADAASFGAGRSEALAPAAPLLTRILGQGLALPAGSWPAVRLVARADRALRAGNQPEARQLLEQASAALPPGAPPCSVRGALDYLRMAAARLGFGAGDDQASEELGQSCTAATSVPPDEADMQRYLRELGALESNLGTAAAELPDPWSVPSELEAWARGIDGFAAKLGGRRAAVLRALRDDLLARTARPAGSCDLAFDERTRTAREAARKALQAAGRDDLALPSIETKRDGLRVTVVNTDPLLAWIARPENRWLRAATWSAVLADLSLALVAEVDRDKLARICQLAYGDVLRDMKQDQLDGAYERNVARWFSVARGSTICRNVEAVGELGNELFAGAVKGVDGKLGVVRVLWLSGWRVVQGFLTGRPDEGVMAVKVLGDQLGRLQQRLGPSDEDRVLDALITVLRVGSLQLLGQPGDIESTLENVVLNLEGLARKPVHVDAPPLAKAAPGVHLAAVAVLAALRMRDDDPKRRDAALERLRIAVDQDLAGLLAGFGVSEHGDAIRRIVRTVPAVARALDSASAAEVDALLREVEQADAPGPREQGYWAIGLELGRVALWDLAAAAAYQAVRGKVPATGDKPTAAPGKRAGAGAAPADLLADPRVARALERSDRVLVRLADGVVRDFGHDGSGWEALYLGPALQRGLAAVFAAPEDAPDMAARVAGAAEAGLAAGLPRMSQKLRAARPDEVGFLAVVVDALQAAEAEGGLRNLAADPGARTRWAGRMKQRSTGYPREFRVVVDATIAGLEFESSPAEAKRRLRQAVSDATSTQLRDVAYLPRLAEAVLLHYDGETEAALAVVDEVLALGNEALGCGRPHEVHGLMPYRAWALERLGKHAEADAMLNRYLELGKSYGGDGFVHCRIASYRPTFTFTADVKQRVGSLFFPTTAEGSFQVGMGSGDARNVDRLACAPTPLWAPRYDLVLSAQLARAAYALRAGNDAAAHGALLAALDTGRLLLHGDVRSLGVADGTNAELGRKQAFLPLLVWVATAARGRGQLAVAAELDGIAQSIAEARGETIASVFSGRPGTPVQLALLGFDHLGSLVASTWQAPDATAAGTAARIGPPGAGQGASGKGGPRSEALGEAPVVPAWGIAVLEAYSALRNNRAAQARAAVSRARPPASDALARLALLRAKIWVGQQRPKGAELKAMMDELARVGLLGEAAGLGAEQAASLGQAKKLGEAAELYRHALTLLPAERAPLLRAEILRQLGGTLTDEPTLASWARDMVAVAPALQGRIPLDQELNLLQQLVVVLLRERDLARLEAPVERLRAIFENAAGADDPQTLQLAVAALALHSVAAGPPGAELGDLLAKARRLGEPGKPLVPILEQLERNRNDPAERRRLAIEVMDQLARR